MKSYQGIQTLKPQSQSSNNVRRIKCMFTTQLTKKRKTWSDGVLKVFYTGGGYQCSLIDTGKLRETSLTSRQLESVEVQKLKKNEEVELEFESYLVTVSAGINDYDAVAPPLKLPKFIPPSKYVVIPKTVEVPATVMRNTMPTQSGPYRVTADELDDIWDRDESIPKNRTNDHINMQDVPNPASWSSNISNGNKDNSIPEHSIYNFNNTTKEKTVSTKQLSLHGYLHDSSSSILESSIQQTSYPVSNSQSSATGTGNNSINRKVSDSSLNVLNRTQPQSYKQQSRDIYNNSGSGGVDNDPTTTPIDSMRSERLKQFHPPQQQQQFTSIPINKQTPMPQELIQVRNQDSDIPSRSAFTVPISSQYDVPKSREGDGPKTRDTTVVGAAYSTIISNSIWDDD